MYLIEHWLEKGFNENEAIEKVKEIKNKTSCWNKEFWIKRGFSEDEAIKKVKQKQSRNGNNASKIKTNVFLEETWVKKGMSEKDAEQKVKELKSSTSINNLSIGLKEKILKNRKQTYYSKSKEDRNKINKSRGRTKEQLINKFGIEYFNKISIARGKSKKNTFFRRYSKISNSFFNDLQKNVVDNLFYGENEKWIRYNKNKGFYVDLLLNKKIIEFNGDFYHANPLKYEADSIINIAKKNILTAKEIWKKDEFKITTLKKLGYEILIIWENDITENYQNMLNKCKTFLYE